MNQDHAMTNMTLPFLRLPLQIQLEVVNKFSTTLIKASKKVFDVATPLVNYKVGLKMSLYREGVESVEWKPKYRQML